MLLTFYTLLRINKPQTFQQLGLVIAITTTLYVQCTHKTIKNGKRMIISSKPIIAKPIKKITDFYISSLKFINNTVIFHFVNRYRTPNYVVVGVTLAANCHDSGWSLWKTGFFPGITLVEISRFLYNASSKSITHHSNVDPNSAHGYLQNYQDLSFTFQDNKKTKKTSS